MQKTLFDEIEPFNVGHLSSKDGHDVYFEESGNPSGQPIIFLHGGPGGGTGPKQRRFFDPKHYRIILFDQRGCGQSKPLGETQNNTTQHLIDDIETIRIHLKIDQWILFGGSWGSTLALAYGIQHKDRVQGLILRGIFLSRKHELSWFLNEVDQFFPELHAKLLSHKTHITKSNLVDAYYELVFSEDLDEAKQAAFAWNQFEGSILKLLPEEESSSEPINYDFELARAKVQLHYIKEDCYVNGNELLEKSAALNDIPVVIVQGRYDMVCPPKTAYELSKQMPNAQIIMVPNAGHSASEDGTLAALIQATEKFKKIK